MCCSPSIHLKYFQFKLNLIKHYLLYTLNSFHALCIYLTAGDGDINLMAVAAGCATTVFHRAD